MRELSLFSGYGGFSLGLRYSPGVVGAVPAGNLMALPQKDKRGTCGSVCIVCGEYVFSAEGLAQHYRDRHMEKK